MNNSPKKNNSFLYIFIVILFLALGIILGVYGTKKYLDSKSEEETPEIVADGVIDITDKKEYSETIDKLYSLISGNSIFYSSKGISLETMDNNTKLSLMYTYALNNSLGSSEQLPWSYWGSGTCANDFIVDPLEEETSQICSVVTIPVSTINDNYKKLFNSTLIDTSVNFKPSTFKSCVLDGDNYVCGNVGSVVNGSLDSKFEIQKVTLDNDIISIYDKGYLLDTRSDRINSEDGYSNHYLHTADSTEYYYELKSADNVTFKHNFKKADDNNYYYVSTEVVEKE